MSVYVDELKQYPKHMITKAARRYGTYWCHMWADTEDELWLFARVLGFRKSWAQRSKTGFLHFDLTPSRRVKAISLGAKVSSLHTFLGKKRSSDDEQETGKDLLSD